MSKNKSIIEKIASGKGFYITAALSFVLIIAAIAFVYNSSVDMLHDLDIPTTVEQVEKNQTNVSDPRKYDEDEAQDITDDAEDSAEESTSAEETRQSTTAESTTQKVSETTTEETTEPVEVFSNDAFIYPSSGDIDRVFSLSPVYDETMEDWRTHKGTDFLGEQGSEVASIGNGKVVKVVSDTSWGYCIDIDYGSFTARYCGIEQGTAVGIDDTVSKGDIIGKLGSIPCESKQESHLHFEIIKDGVNIDPIKALGE